MKYEEPYEFALRMAKKEIGTSDHLTYVTYMTVKNPKFLISVAEHITKAAKLALQALLEFELAYKRIGPYVSELASQIDLFEDDIYERYEFPIEHLKLLRRLKKLEKGTKEAIISFRREQKYYFGGPNMHTESVDIDDIKKYLKFTKSFIAKVGTIIGVNK